MKLKLSNMPYWFLNKQTNTPEIFGSVIAVSEHTGISKDTLYDYFSRKKVSEYYLVLF